MGLLLLKRSTHLPLAWGCVAASCYSLGQPPVFQSPADGMPMEATSNHSCVQVGTPERLVTRLGSNVYVEAPRVLRTGDGVVLIGAPTIEWSAGGEEPVPRVADDSGAPLFGVLLAPDGRASIIPGPADGSGIRTVRAGVDERGRLHALWAPIDSAGRHRNTLMHSVYDRGRWSRSSEIAMLPPFGWDTGVSELVASSLGLTLAVPGMPRHSEANAIYLLSYQNESWAIDSVLVQTPPAYVQVLPQPTGGVVLAYVATLPNSAPGIDVNSIFVVATSAGRPFSVSAPVNIFKSGRTSAHSPVAASDASGFMALAWRQMGDTQRPNNIALVTMSRDAGKTWGSHSTLDQGSSGVLPQVSLLSDASILVISGSALDQSEVILRTLKDGAIETVGGPWQTETSPTFGTVGRDSFLLTFTETEELRTPLGKQHMPVTYLVSVAFCAMK